MFSSTLSNESAYKILVCIALANDLDTESSRGFDNCTDFMLLKVLADGNI